MGVIHNRIRRVISEIELWVKIKLGNTDFHLTQNADRSWVFSKIPTQDWQGGESDVPSVWIYGKR